MLCTSCNDRKMLIRASSAHRYVVKMDRRRVVRVSGMSYGKTILSIENLGWVLWVLVEFHFLWIKSDYEFYSGFQMKCTNISCTVFASCYSLVPLLKFVLFFVFYQRGKKQVMQSCIFVLSSSCRTVNILNTGLLFLNR